MRKDAIIISFHLGFNGKVFRIIYEKERFKVLSLRLKTVRLKHLDNEENKQAKTKGSK